MPVPCQACGCSNHSGRVKKSTFPIPDPTKSSHHRRLCKKWLRNIQNPKLNFKTFRAHPSKRICEDHFTPDSFCGIYDSPVARSLNIPCRRKTLKNDAVPTLFSFQNFSGGERTKQQRLIAESIIAKKLKARLRDETQQMRHAIKVKQEASQRDAENCELKICDLDTPCSQLVSDQSNLLVETNLTQDAESCDSEICDLNTPIIQPVLDQSDVLVETNLIQESKNESENEEEDKQSGVKECGHPCVLCYQSLLNAMPSKKDHTYTARIKFVSAGTQTDPHVAETFKKSTNTTNYSMDTTEILPTVSTPS